MAPSRKDGLGRDEDSDRSPDGDAAEGYRENEGSGSAAAADHPLGRGVGVVGRLRGLLRGESDGDLSHEGSGGWEDGVLRWLHALDLQVLGACRADERSKPLLKLNVSSGPAEERLLAQLSQHFEASEVGMLARCLYVPLVSVRVGKVKKRGNILCPTPTRGRLNLNLLPSSNMHISFTGDDGCTERLAVLSNEFDSSDVIIKEISADTSGRSFLLKFPGHRALYYWCSEKSKLHGLELLAKMKDLLRRKPSLSCLTGISESRLDSFATHLRAYLLGCSNAAEANSAASSHGVHGDSATDQTECHSSSCALSKSSRLRAVEAHIGKVHSFCQGSLSPRLNTFKDEMRRPYSSIRSGAREKIKRHGDTHPITLTRSTELVTSVSASCTATSKCEDDNSRGTGPSSTLSCCLPDVLPIPLSSFSPMSIHLPLSQTGSGSLFSPYYCWCPPCPSSLQYEVAPSHLLPVSPESISLPPLSSLLSATAPVVTSVPARLTIDVAELQTLTLPSLVPDPLVPASLSVSSFTLPSSQQLPIFTPFISDPIVHIPLIDVCSSGQGYLVSAGPAISTVISPLLPNLVNPLIPQTESVVEKNARETLEMLLASAPIASGPRLMNVLPAVFNNLSENFTCDSKVNNHSAIAATSSQFDVATILTDLSCKGLCSLEEGAAQEVDGSMRGNMEEHNEGEDYDLATKSSTL
ncbi:hypothetical protein MUK42_16463 [Musa troglodytarum]|uniref:Uncharacterized protein n=1 Tax=Musa troglodytarum TaxID=320322 RepID=A0A9E7HMX7_9LILI|nr:hypothetical protein MUK42_16463 [Musa troglodytarum]